MHYDANNNKSNDDDDDDDDDDNNNNNNNNSPSNRHGMQFATSGCKNFTPIAGFASLICPLRKGLHNK
jgi:hypothetical protein